MTKNASFCQTAKTHFKSMWLHSYDKHLGIHANSNTMDVKYQTLTHFTCGLSFLDSS